jgi:uncharacterized SAM-binding protein YcdF (DUF218 family)
MTGLAVGGLTGLIVLELALMPAVSIWGESSWLPPAAAVAFALAWLTPLRRLVAALALAAAALWLLVSFTPATRLLSDGLVRRDPLRTADAVFVFASRVQADGEPTADAMSRLLKGLQLVSEGRAPRLIVSETPHSRPYAEIAREWARDMAPKAEILVVGPIRNSREEAVAVARLCREHGWRRVVAVTSPVHTRRAAAALEGAGLEVVAVPSVEARYDLETLDQPGDRRRGFAAALHERLGWIAYSRRGWLGPGR